MATKKAQQADLKNVGKDEDETTETSANGTQVQAAFGTSNMEDVEEMEKKKLDKALSQVKVSRDDVKLIAEQLEIDSKIAERALKQNKGDVVATLKGLVDGG
eukprot:CAMPEP_0174285964 /NCGR_PEP_ID=MMETSP0809-20121228/10142_1 /TAXON_ID=73025 ORGANISM="Eutreptiella gymnastica-like, Strain CCMP1594" /NCGR_SAMPLE_ID=MMETSP0809 /ASSEMBLY_ACC=CAM_ASM_000658 /LENGTH=101 /DNA_ID=CAMNT_0015381859 /DNA_START=16 /DNA_END=321 /DNA_ORIENTATION=-